MVALAASMTLLLSGFSHSSRLFEDGELKDSAVSPHALGRLLPERLQEGDLSGGAQLGLAPNSAFPRRSGSAMSGRSARRTGQVPISRPISSGVWTPAGAGGIFPVL